MSQIMQQSRKAVCFQLLKNYSWQVMFGINNFPAFVIESCDLFRTVILWG